LVNGFLFPALLCHSRLWFVISEANPFPALPLIARYPERSVRSRRTLMKLGSTWHLASVCLCIAVVFAPAKSHAQSDSTLIGRIDDHYNHLRTLRAHYTEHYKGMGLDRTESGTLTLKKPGLMRWSYDTPSGKVFVLDGHFAWFYTPGDAQVTRTPSKQLDDLRSPLRFLLGHTQLARELDHLTSAPMGPNFLITGIPKGMAERVHALSLIVTPSGAIQSMKIEETDGALTEFTFTSIDENAPVPATDFVFVPPAGISIVNGQSPI
jgi:outer membrane lipoprotein carrier protein